MRRGGETSNSEKQILSSGPKINRAGHGRRKNRNLSENGAVKMKFKSMKEDIIMVNSKVSLIAKVCIVAVALFLLPAFVFAEQPGYGFHTGDREFTLSGSGSSDHSLRRTDFATSLGLGYFFSDNFEGAIRQDIGLNDRAGSSWSGATTLAIDYHFKLGSVVQPLIGASFGYSYGDRIKDQWGAGPEAGVKVFINGTTFVRALVQYEFPVAESFKSDGRFIYGLGLGVRF
jgi:hypothetical protein